LDTKELVLINFTHNIQMISKYFFIVKNESSKDIINMKSIKIRKKLLKKNVENDRKN